MKFKQRPIFTFLILILMVTVSLCQAKDERGYYMVEAEKFTPPIKDMIASFEGRSAEGFLAPDIYGTEHYLFNFRGKPVFLFFFNLDEEDGRKLLDKMKIIHQNNGTDISIIGMAKNQKLEMIEYFGDQKIAFPVIYNGEVFGQMAYGADLGSPRLFVINKDGIIKRVLPSSLFQSDEITDNLIAECVNNIKN